MSAMTLTQDKGEDLHSFMSRLKIALDSVGWDAYPDERKKALDLFQRITDEKLKDECMKKSNNDVEKFTIPFIVEIDQKLNKETENERRKEEEANTERKRKAEEEKAEYDEKYRKLKEDIKIKEELLKVKQQSALQHMTDMYHVKDPTLMRSLSTAARLDQEAATNLTTEVLELKNKLTKLVAKKPKLS